MQACQRGNNNVVPQQRSAGLHPRVDPKLAQWLRHARHTLTSTSCNAAERHIHKLHCQPHRAQACVSHASSLQLVPNRHGDAKIQRRHLLQQVLLATTAAALSGFGEQHTHQPVASSQHQLQLNYKTCLAAEPAQADLFRDLVKGYVRPVKLPAWHPCMVILALWAPLAAFTILSYGHLLSMKLLLERIFKFCVVQSSS